MNRPPAWRQPLLFQPYERATPYSFSRVVDEVRAVWFPELEVDLEVRIDPYGPLACLWYHRMGLDRHIVCFHPILNRPGVPEEVVRFVAKHELTHIVVPDPGHSIAFWEKEREIGPERQAVLQWSRSNLGRAFVTNQYLLRVRKDWMARLPREPIPYMPHLALFDEPFERLCPGGGAQLQFEPTWSPGPAPMALEPIPARHSSRDW